MLQKVLCAFAALLFAGTCASFATEHKNYFNIQVEECSGLKVSAGVIMNIFDDSPFARKEGITARDFPVITRHKDGSCHVTIQLKDVYTGEKRGEEVLQVQVLTPSGEPWKAGKDAAMIRLLPYTEA